MRILGRGARGFQWRPGRATIGGRHNVAVVPQVFDEVPQPVGQRGAVDAGQVEGASQAGVALVGAVGPPHKAAAVGVGGHDAHGLRTDKTQRYVLRRAAAGDLHITAAPLHTLD